MLKDWLIGLDVVNMTHPLESMGSRLQVDTNLQETSWQFQKGVKHFLEKIAFLLPAMLVYSLPAWDLVANILRWRVKKPEVPYWK